jgi:hypothetical protein
MTKIISYRRKLFALTSILDVFKSYGVLNGFLQAFNVYKSWSIYDLRLRKDNSAETSNASSTSDTFNYNSICKLASIDEDVFYRFKSCIEYQKILEHVSIDLGYKYFSIIRSKVNALSPELKFVIKFDKCRPPKQFYRGLGIIPSSNLRYAFVSLDLNDYFGSLDNFSVCEIGAGYGGQAFQICYLNKIKQYKLVDLPASLALARKYLASCSIKADFEFVSAEETPKSTDLVISNYAFSELRREVQDSYLERYLLGAKRGYITFNQETPKEWGSYTIEELQKLIPDLKIMPDPAQQRVGGAILTWDHSLSVK